MTTVFLRRANLGRSSVLGIKRAMTTPTATYKPWENKVYGNVSDTITVVRWGCTANIPQSLPYTTIINKASAIHGVNDKRYFRQLLTNEYPELIPQTFFEVKDNLPYPLIVRPAKHSQGKNLWVVNSLEELVNVVSSLPSWYASRLINKVSEFRVYVANGRVITVAQKTPEDPTAVAWNVAQGGRFDVVPWGQWNLDVCRNAIESFSLSELDFGGVDVMTNEGGRPYTIEINSAPSLPFLSDNKVSYRQTCMAKYFDYVSEKGNNWIEPTGFSNWRDVIHPAIWSEGGN